jgi:hypothetical protein
MAEFSRFGNPSQEWQEHVERYGPPPDVPIGKVPAVTIQKSTNKSRDEASEKQMKDEGEQRPLLISSIFINLT